MKKRIQHLLTRAYGHGRANPVPSPWQETAEFLRSNRKATKPSERTSHLEAIEKLLKERK